MSTGVLWLVGSALGAIYVTIMAAGVRSLVDLAARVDERLVAREQQRKGLDQ